MSTIASNCSCLSAYSISLAWLLYFLMVTISVEVQLMMKIWKWMQYKKHFVEHQPLSTFFSTMYFFYYLKIAYFFAVLITGHLYQVLNDNYRGYMKSTLTNKKIILGLLVIFILYLLPWIFIYDEELFYYYPTGFYYKD